MHLSVVSMDSKDFQISLQNKCQNSFNHYIEQGFALVYIDAILLLSNHKLHMLELIEELHKISTKNNIKLAPEKSFYLLQKD